MTATASLRALNTADRHGRSSQPIVRIDGQVREDVFVERLTMQSSFDRRTAVMRMVGADSAPITGQRVDVLLPVLLAGGSGRLAPMFTGRVTLVGHDRGARHERRQVQAVCDWTAALDELWEDHTPQDATAGSWLAGLNAWYGLKLSTTPVPAEALAEPVRPGTWGTVGKALQAILSACDCCVQRELTWLGNAVVERRTLRPTHCGRPVRLATTDLANPAGVVAAIERQRRVTGPTKLIAEAPGPVVESTFELRPAWDSASEGLAPSEYVRSTSSDFEAVANVYRLWALNEDASLPGDPFDLTMLFGQGTAVEPTPVPFGDTLTRDKQGRSLGVVVEVSTNGGTDWQRYGQQATVLRDRAGVYLTDDELPAAFFAAATAGQARVRVTATLQSPTPVTCVRWIGNPFAGKYHTRRLDTGQLFGWRRVDEASRYHSAIRSGQMAADEADDRTALESWLARQASPSPHPTNEIVVTTSKCLDSLRVGDQLTIAGDTRLTAPWPVLSAITHDWTRGASQITWPTAGGAAW